jgi:hypothetical protein
LIGRREVRATGGHEEVLLRDGDWSYGRKMERRKTYQENGTEIEVPQRASQAAVSRLSVETTQEANDCIRSGHAYGDNPYTRSISLNLYDVFIRGW